MRIALFDASQSSSVAGDKLRVPLALGLLLSLWLQQGQDVRGRRRQDGVVLPGAQHPLRTLWKSGGCNGRAGSIGFGGVVDRLTCVRASRRVCATVETSVCVS